MTNTVRSILTDLKRRATYRYLNADVESPRSCVVKSL